MIEDDDLFGTEPHKLVRTDSPDTSVAAAHSVDSTKLEREVYEVICGFGAAGCISDEVRSHFPNKPYSSVTARYKALLDRQHIYDTGKRKPGRSGRGQRIVAASKFKV